MGKKIDVPTSIVQLCDDPGQDLPVFIPARADFFALAKRLMLHTEGTITGKSGLEPTNSIYTKGSLTLEEALYCVQFAISRGLNPFGDIHIWYYHKIYVTEHYRIMVGWANLREPFTAHYYRLDSNDDMIAHGLVAGDLGVICYIMKRKDQDHFRFIYGKVMEAYIKLGMGLDLDAISRAAYKESCAYAIGKLDPDEMMKDGKPKKIDVKGWTWEQRARIRALRNALGQSHGTPTPAEIKAYAQKINPSMTISGLLSDDYDPNLPKDAQEGFFRAHNAAEAAIKKNGTSGKMSFDDRVNLVRDTDRSDPIGEGEFIEGGFDSVPQEVKFRLRDETGMDILSLKKAFGRLGIFYDRDNVESIIEDLIIYRDTWAEKQ